MPTIDFLLDFGPWRVAMIAYDLFTKLWIYLGIGIVIGAAFAAFVPTGKVIWIFKNSHSTKAIFIAAALGVISPLSSYAVIPIFAALLGMGIPLAPVMAFLASSPIISPIIFYLTAQMLGIKFAMGILFSAFAVGAATGLAFRFLARWPAFQNLPGTMNYPNFGQATLPANVMAEDASIPMDVKIEKLAAIMDRKHTGSKWKVFFTQLLKMTRYVGVWFMLSIVIAAIVDEYVPMDWVVRYMGGHWSSLLLASAMSIPFYICGGGAIPLIWDLMHSGMDQGAAMTFFISGPVTKIAPMATVILLMRFKIFSIYFGISMGMGLLLGFLYHYA